MANVNTAFTAFDTFTASARKAGSDMCAALKAAGYTTYESVFEVATLWAAKRAGCPMVKAERGDKMVMDRNHATYEAARKARTRVCDMFKAPVRAERPSGHAAKPVVTRAQRAAATAFLAEFGGDTLEAQIKAAVAALRALA